jgi:hypothetical protein
MLYVGHYLSIFGKSLYIKPVGGLLMHYVECKFKLDLIFQGSEVITGIFLLWILTDINKCVSENICFCKHVCWYTYV